ncbi:major head protein [Nostoc phage Nsp-JY21]
MTEIYLYGTVGASWWDEDSFTAKSVRDQLAGLSGPLTVRINSGGGIATEGQAIYTALRGYDGPVNIVVEGIAASAASLIAMAGDTITMSTGAILMIHDPAAWYVEGRGTEDDHLQAAQMLRTIANAYAGIYAKRAGITVDEARAVMKAETYYDGPGAVEAGFATAIDDEAEEQAVAQFDYRIYQHAPKGLLTAAGALQRQRPRETVLAMMAGAANPNRKNGGNLMRKSKVTAATAADDEDQKDMKEEDDIEAEDQDDEDLTAEDEEDTTAEGDDEDPEAEDEEDEAKAENEEEMAAKAVTDLARRSKRARAVMTVCRNLGRPMKEALGFIRDGVSATVAGDQILAKLYKGDPMKGKSLRGGPVATITRDEGETRRAGMAVALQARLGVKNVKVEGSPARPYMDMRLSDMAAASLGRRRAPIDAEGRLRVFMAASLSTSDFSAVFENALNKRLQQDYAIAQPTYREIAQRMDFTDYRPHPVAGVGELGQLTEIKEGAEIKAGNFNDKRESLTLKAFGMTAEITEQMIVNDDLGAIATVLARSGMVVAANEDKQFYEMAFGGAGGDGPTLGETTRQMFNATDVTKAGTAAAITIASLTAARTALMTKKSLGGLDLALVPSILLVGPAKLTEAQQIVAPLQADQAGNVNPFAGTLRIVVTPKITGNAWYLFADPAIAANFAYGFLQGSEGPQVRNETPIGRLGMIYQITHRFGAGGIDFRAGFKNPGA